MRIASESRAGFDARACSEDSYEQPGNWIASIQVDQLNVPLTFKYSLLYANRQSLVGSIDMLL